MSRPLTVVLTVLAMLAFAGNSILCRLALKHTAIDAATFTSIRLLAGALTLWLILRLRGGSPKGAGNWGSALALFAYAAGFSFAYINLTAATGALLLFGSVQATMIGVGLWRGERLTTLQSLGLLCAMSGLAALLWPGLSAPPPLASALMVGAGIAWGIYSLRGKGAGDPTVVTAGNFLRAVPISIAMSLAAWSWQSVDQAGVVYALASGALASGVGYAIWYTALRGLKATSAATVQLSVPAIAAAGGVVFLGEAMSMNLVLASATILGGIGLVVWGKR
jgi:drug/metabolite transporter (DMT)-like permease